MDIIGVLEVPQALALVASAARMSLGIAREVKEMVREHRHRKG